ERAALADVLGVVGEKGVELLVFDLELDGDAWALASIVGCHDCSCAQPTVCEGENRVKQCATSVPSVGPPSSSGSRLPYSRCPSSISSPTSFHWPLGSPLPSVAPTSVRRRSGGGARRRPLPIARGPTHIPAVRLSDAGRARPAAWRRSSFSRSG